MRLYEPPQPIRKALAELDRPPRILDLGGHVGVFGVYILTIVPEAKLLSLEPDPRSFELLSLNAGHCECSWTVVEAAAAAESGWAPFTATGGPGSGLKQHGPVISEDESEVLTLDVLPLLRRVDLAKIDIEGGEWPILGDPRWADCAPELLAVEFHPEGCPRNDHQSAAIEAVDAAGMDHEIIAGTPAGAGMLWAWRRS